MNEDILNIDEFLPIGVDQKKKEETSVKPSVFTKDVDLDMSFLEDKDDKTEEKVEDPSTIIKDIIDEPFIENKKTSSGVSDHFKKLFDNGTLLPFDDEKSLDEYTTKDFQELIELNFEEKLKDLKENINKSFFDDLPEELKYAADYFKSGGNNIRGLFKILSQSEEVKALDPDVEEDQEVIVRQFLSASNFGTREEIDEQVDNWKEMNQLGKWAKKHKPKLDQMYKAVIEKQLVDQENAKKEQIKRKEAYLDSVYNTLNKGELNGIKLDSKKQKFLWEEMTQTKYTSITGRPTNLLGHLLEEYQFGENPRYDLITEALWLLQDPEGYKAEVSKKEKEELNTKIVRNLKTEQDKKLNTTAEIEDKETSRRTIQRTPTNIFKRR